MWSSSFRSSLKNKMNSTARITMLGLLTLVFLAGAAFEVRLISKTKIEVSSLIAEAGSLSGNSGTAQSIRSIQKESKDDIATLEGTVITRSGLASFIGLIEQAGKEAGLSVSISSVKTEAGSSASTTPETVRIVADTTGTWAANLAFIRQVGKLPYKISIDSTSLKLGEVGWRGGVTLRVLVFPDTP